MTARGWVVGALTLLAACTRSGGEAPQSARPAQAEAPAAARGPVSLELNGFNYTDLYIDSFEVDGQGGGNLYVSSPTSGGGGSVCCVSAWLEGKAAPRVRIRWTRDGRRWCEQDVTVTGVLSPRARHLGVHFFPDGHIEAELSEDYPRLKLQLEQVRPEERKASGNTVADERFARCEDGR